MTSIFSLISGFFSAVGKFFQWKHDAEERAAGAAEQRDADTGLNAEAQRDARIRSGNVALLKRVSDDHGIDPAP